MFLRWFILVASIVFSAVHVLSKDVSRVKRSDDSVPCQEGWSLFGEKCFKLFSKSSQKTNWGNAKQRCEDGGGNLATVHSQKEHDFLTTLIMDQRTNAWIGLHDQPTESHYEWVDGSEFNYTNWSPGEPLDRFKDSEDCVEMYFAPDFYDFNINIIGKWNDVDCRNAYPYICEKKINNALSSPNPLYCLSEDGGGWKFQNSCYHLVTESKTWDEAEQHCKDTYNGHLLTVLDVTADLYVQFKLPTNDSLWVGIKTIRGYQQKWTSGWYVAYNGIDLNREHRTILEGTCVLRDNLEDYALVPCDEKHSFICEANKAQPPVLKPPSVSGSQCPNYPINWRDLGGEFCYYFETKKKVNWYEANFDCMRRGGTLVSIHSKEETDMLQTFIRYTQHTMFIGLYRELKDEDHFAWADGTPTEYTEWKPNEPNTMDEKCTEIYSAIMKWNDLKCDDKRGYICSAKKVLPPDSTPITETTGCTDSSKQVSSDSNEQVSSDSNKQVSSDSSKQVSIKPISSDLKCESSHYTCNVLIGVCIFLVLIILGVVIYGFRLWAIGKTTTTRPHINDWASYTSNTELTLKDEPRYIET